MRLRALLAGCALLLALFEIGAGWMTSHLRSRRTVRNDVQSAIALGGPGSVLVVGNSLVQHGVDMPAVRRALGDGYTPSKLAIVDSGYLDWLYGIASLFDRGSRPDAVVLGISPTQLIADHAPTGAATRMVWTAANLARYAVESPAGLTAASDRFFEHESEFFAIRSRFRQDVRRFIVPGYESMAREFFVTRADVPDTLAGERVAEARLRDLSAECARHGTRFVYLLIPTNTPADAVLERAIVAAGQRSGVPVLIPVSNSSLDSSWLLDGYHLNARGAVAFSARAGEALSAELEQPKSGGRFAAPRISTLWRLIR
jgi:hypothetical protein